MLYLTEREEEKLKSDQFTWYRATMFETSCKSPTGQRRIYRSRNPAFNFHS